MGRRLRGAPRFEPFGVVHLVAVLVVVSVIALVVAFGRRQPLALAERGGRALGIALLVYYGVEAIVRVALLDVRPMQLLPLELCSALFFVGAHALVTGHRVSHDVLYFWTFAGTLHSLVTPTPGAGFPSLELVRYFACHGLLVLAASYSLIALGRRPDWRSLLHAALALQLMEIVVGLFDWLTGENFMYLRHAPPSPTLIDSLGAWPIYLLSLEVVALLSFAVWLGIGRLVPPRADSPAGA